MAAGRGRCRCWDTAQPGSRALDWSSSSWGDGRCSHGRDRRCLNGCDWRWRCSAHLSLGWRGLRRRWSRCKGIFLGTLYSYRCWTLDDDLFVVLHIVEGRRRWQQLHWRARRQRLGWRGPRKWSRFTRGRGSVLVRHEGAAPGKELAALRLWAGERVRGGKITHSKTRVSQVQETRCERRRVKVKGKTG